ncbi:hypothetical protein DT076_05395 [Desertihabitans brevis]|uniref:Uncharacterized protein n=1 Tax=Desertihabitans brevis TaxID=2268447 RepID=A0A367Z0P4_9ACTN|nr:hypothetical protein [Desertihabitans brevis]RCK70822.1 hypothetical protein DT076_05395 [Desertihabitans brevis]
MSGRGPRPTLVQCLGYAVCGELLEEAGPATGRVVADAVGLLEQHGWDASAVRAGAERCWAAEEPWPRPLPDGWLPPGEHARYQAALQQLLTRLGVRRSVVARPDVRPSQRDRDLGRERPPHW